MAAVSVIPEQKGFSDCTIWAAIKSIPMANPEIKLLMHLLKEQRGGKKFVIDIEDTYTTAEGSGDEIIKTTYKQRVIDYLAENGGNDTLRKIQHFEQLSSADIEELERIFFEELGTRDEYDKLTEGHPYKNNVAAFIRVINGIDRKKALQIYQHS